MIKERPEFQKIQKVLKNNLAEKKMPNETIDEISQSLSESIISKLESYKKGKMLTSH